MTRQKGSGRERATRVKKKFRSENERFMALRMWLAYLVSMTTRDRGTIPENIGNNILITNNMYVTKNYLSSVILIVELSINTPVTFLGELIANELRRENSTAVVDFTMKNNRKRIDLNDAGLKSRRALWEFSLTSYNTKEHDKKRAARLLYTLEQVEQGHILVDSKIFLTIRAKTGTELSKAESIVYNYLTKIGCLFRPINSGLHEYLDYMMILSDSMSKETKTIPSITNSIKTLCQMLPNTHAVPDHKGIYFGTNMINRTPFRVDFRNITVGRNIYIITNTGGGKTAMILNICASALEEGYNLCVMDIKGNEFSSIVDAVGGVTISLRETSKEYINTFRMIKEEADDENCEQYFKNRLNFSKRQMIILSGVTNEAQITMMEGFLDEFLDHMYTARGIRSDNRNTWERSDDLNPYIVWDILHDYINDDIKNKYLEIMNYVLTNLRMYFSRSGSKSYIFSKELQYKDLLDRRAIRFDFGILAGTTYDPTIFKLKFEYMSRINGEYITRNFDSGIDTVKILEESQAVGSDVIEAYAREYTLRRAQRQTTFLIGNSVDAIVRNPKAMPLIETTTGLLIGKLNKATADLVIKYFDVNGNEDVIRAMSEDNQYLRHFLFVNNMEPDALTPIIKVQYDPKVKYKILTPSKSGDM